MCSLSTTLDHSQTLPVDAMSTGFEEKDTATVGVLEDGASEGASSLSPVRLRTRTTSMYSPSTSPTLPVFRPLTLPPGDIAITRTEEAKFDPSSILLRPISGLSISSAPSTPIGTEMHQQQSRRSPLTSNPTHLPQSYSQSYSDQQHPRTRPRSISLPAAFSLSLLAPSSLSGTNKRPANSSSSRLLGRSIQECEDLSQAYLTPPPSPSGPIIVSSDPAPHEQHYPRYAHMASATHVHTGAMSPPGLEPMGATKSKGSTNRVTSGPASLGSGKGRGNGIPSGFDLVTVLEGGTEDAQNAGGYDVALEPGRAKEGRIVW